MDVPTDFVQCIGASEAWRPKDEFWVTSNHDSQFRQVGLFCGEASSRCAAFKEPVACYVADCRHTIRQRVTHSKSLEVSSGVNFDDTTSSMSHCENILYHPFSSLHQFGCSGYAAV